MLLTLKFLKIYCFFPTYLGREAFFMIQIVFNIGWIWNLKLFWIEIVFF